MLWAFVAVALALSILAFWQTTPRAAWMGLVAALVYLPFALYLAANPGTRWLGPAVQMLYFAAAYLLYRGPRWAAALLTAPAFILAGYIAYLVITSNPS
jgi:hypothetical protein